jgi:hypothetical protein
MGSQASRQMSDRIVEFFSGAADSSGRRLDEILGWSDERLEHVHDYIQWVFPTRQPSGVNPLAPLVADATAAAFAADPALRDRLRAALDRMLAFYGLRRDGDRIQIDPSCFDERSAVWLHAGNHNHLRLTRIMDSLAALGLEADSRALRRCLLEDVVPRAGARVTPRTRHFWEPHSP